VSELVVTVFRVLGRAEHQTYDRKTNEWKLDLLIQPMMVREGSDAALPSPRSSGDGAPARADTPLRLAP
jgi:hypothetical protein